MLSVCHASILQACRKRDESSDQMLPPPKLSGANLLDLGTKGKVKKVFGEAEKQNSIIRHAFCYLRYDFL